MSRLNALPVADASVCASFSVASPVRLRAPERACKAQLISTPVWFANAMLARFVDQRLFNPTHVKVW